MVNSPGKNLFWGKTHPEEDKKLHSISTKSPTQCLLNCVHQTLSRGAYEGCNVNKMMDILGGRRYYLLWYLLMFWQVPKFWQVSLVRCKETPIILFYTKCLTLVSNIFSPYTNNRLLVSIPWLSVGYELLHLWEKSSLTSKQWSKEHINFLLYPLMQTTFSLLLCGSLFWVMSICHHLGMLPIPIFHYFGILDSWQKTCGSHTANINIP